jgi:hypothetical protein
VLKPGGRVLAVDFGGPENGGGIVAHLHRHGHIPLPEIVGLLRDAKLNALETGAVGLRGLQFVLAKREAAS